MRFGFLLLVSAATGQPSAKPGQPSAKRLLSSVAHDNAERFRTCSVVQTLALPGVGSSVGIVRSEQNTKNGPANSLEPICSRCASNGPSDEPETCGMPDGAITIPFNTGSLRSGSSSPTRRPGGFGGIEYDETGEGGEQR